MNKSGKSRKILTGEVISTKMTDTLVVRVGTSKKHPRYNKRYIMHKNYMAHDKSGAFSEGDKITIEESSPFSKTKRWVVKNESPKESKG